MRLAFAAADSALVCLAAVPAPRAQYRVLFDASNFTTRSVDNVRVLGEGTIAMRFTTMTGASTGLAFDITMLKKPD